MADVKKCKHPMCSCLAQDKSDYCSDYCKDSASFTTLACDCPHTGCTGHAV